MSFTPVSHSTLGLYQATRQSSVLDQKPSQEQFWGKEGVSFDSLLDVVNPLQQLPVVSTIYRAVTGDTISTGALPLPWSIPLWKQKPVKISVPMYYRRFPLKERQALRQPARHLQVRKQK